MARLTNIPHRFAGRPDRDCEICNKPDRHSIHLHSDRSAEEWREAAEMWQRSYEGLEASDDTIAARLERENDELARGILALQRKLTIAEQAHFLYRSEVERRLSAAEKRTKHAEDQLQTALNLGEMWHGRAQKANAKQKKTAEHWESVQKQLETDKKMLRDLLADERKERAALDLPLAYFPAGEEPDARWGLTDLGQQALIEGWARGPEWTLLVSPDPREVLSIEVRTGSRQEEIYRVAGYVSAEKPEIRGGHFLGLLEAFVEIATAEDETLGRALLPAREGGRAAGSHESGAGGGARRRVPPLREARDSLLRGARLLRGLLLPPERGRHPRPARPGARAEARQEIADLKVLVALQEKKLAPRPIIVVTDKAGVISHRYDLAATCARCGETYERHLRTGAGASQSLPCDGFISAQAAFEKFLRDTEDVETEPTEDHDASL